MTSESSQESYVRSIWIEPFEIEFGSTNSPLKIYLKFNLKQTTFMLLTTYDEDAKATRPGLLFRAHRAQPLESVPLIFNLSCNNSIAALHSCLKDYLGLTKEDESAVVSALLYNLKINKGYKNVRPTEDDNNNNNDNNSNNNRRDEEKQERPQSVRLNVTIDRIGVNHVCGSPKLRPRLLKRKRAEDCSICLQELDDTKKPLSRLGCDHVFHQSCIIRWLESRIASNTLHCPLCRGMVPFGELIASTVKLDVIPL